MDEINNASPSVTATLNKALREQEQRRAVNAVIGAVGDLEGRIGDPAVNEYADEVRRLVEELLSHFDLSTKEDAS